MLIKMVHTGQVIDLIPAAAFTKISAGLAKPFVEEEVETFGSRASTAVETAARFVKKAAAPIKKLPAFLQGFGRA